MMRAWAAIAGVCALGVLSGCSDDERAGAQRGPSRAGGHPSSKQALVDAAVAALERGSGSAYVKLLATVDEVREACPKQVAGRDLKKMRDKWKSLRQQVGRDVERCADLFDWHKAKRVQREGGEVKGVMSGCRTRMRRLGSFILLFELDGRRYRVELRKPYERKGSYGFAAGPRCRPMKADR